MSTTSAWVDIVFKYALTAAGLFVGMDSGGAANWQKRRFLLMAVPTVIVATLVWVIPQGLIWSELRPYRDFAITRYFVMLVTDVFYFFAGRLAGKWAATNKEAPNTNHKRGTKLEPPSVPLWESNPLKADQLTLAGQPLDPADETKHFKLIGTTGTGKSTAVRELLTSALARGDRAIIADPDGSYVQRFYDSRRGDRILNPFDSRSARWNLFAEIQTAYDADQLARSLIPDAEGPEKNWRSYARVFLSSVLRQLHRVQHDDPIELYRLISITPIDDLREILSDTPAGPYLAQDNGKFFGAVRAVANTHLAALEHVALQESGDRLSVRSWVADPERRSRILFLPYKANEIATLKSLISTWLRLAIFETMSRNEGDHRLWFIIDELDALGAIDGLKDALARLRKFGGRCVLGFQSIAQVSGTYGHAEAQTIVENCGNTLILRCSSSEGGGTARFASRLIGEREITRLQVTKSRRPNEWLSSQSIAEHHITESAVLSSEIEQLPDLQGFLKFASTPEWRRVSIKKSLDLVGSALR